MYELARLTVTQPEARTLFGPPHFVDDRPGARRKNRPLPGNMDRTLVGHLAGEDAWAFALPSGQRLLIVFDWDGRATFCANPPELDPILEAFQILPEDPRLTRSEPANVLGEPKSGRASRLLRMLFAILFWVFAVPIGVVAVVTGALFGCLCPPRLRDRLTDELDETGFSFTLPWGLIIWGLIFAFIVIGWGVYGLLHLTGLV
jgi:hypothetical protein